MKYVYPAVFTKGEKFIVASIPDFNIGTQGATVPEAVDMARDAIGLVGITMQDDGESLPSPSSPGDIEPGEGTVVLIDIDFDEYRRRNDERTVRKNCTIPSWLNAEAEKAGINFSAVLRDALKKELHIVNR